MRLYMHMKYPSDYFPQEMKTMYQISILISQFQKYCKIRKVPKLPDIYFLVM